MEAGGGVSIGLVAGIAGSTHGSMELLGGSGMSPPSIGVHWGCTRSFGAGARAGPSSEGGIGWCEDSPRLGTVGDPGRSVEIWRVAKPPSVCAKTGMQTNAADAAPIKNAPTDVIRVVLKASIAFSSR